MSNYKTQSHTLYNCKYHVVFCPKYRNRILKDEIRSTLITDLFSLIKEKDQVEIDEINVQEDHVHMMLDIAPKYSISGVIGFLKGKSTIRMFKKHPNLRKKCYGKGLWSRGFCVGTIGLNEKQIRMYIIWQEKKEKELEN